MDRRSFLILVTAVAGCAPQSPAPPTALSPVWITNAADGAFVVNGVQAELATIDAVVLEQALVLNPTLTPEQARAEVQVTFEVIRTRRRIRIGMFRAPYGASGSSASALSRKIDASSVLRHVNASAA